MASLDFRGTSGEQHCILRVDGNTVERRLIIGCKDLRPQCFFTSFVETAVIMTFAGGECDDEQEATTGGPFSALCESMRPGEEEKEGGDEEVAREQFPLFQH